MIHGLDVTFGAAALFGLAALAMVAFLVHLPAEASDAAPARARADAFVLADEEDLEWSDPGAGGVVRHQLRMRQGRRRCRPPGRRPSAKVLRRYTSATSAADQRGVPIRGSEGELDSSCPGADGNRLKWAGRSNGGVRRPYSRVPPRHGELQSM